MDRHGTLPVRDTALVSGEQTASAEWGARVRALRRKKGVTVRELAELVSLSPGTLSRVERGQAELTIDRFDALCRALGVSVDIGSVQRDAAAGVRRASSATPTGAAGSVESSELRDWRVYAPLELNPVLSAALQAYLKSGYHGASIRDISRIAGMSVPGIYHYYSGKQEMLMSLMELVLDSLTWRTSAARDEGTGPAERFSLIIESFVLHWTHRSELAFIGLSEMRSLEPDNRAKIQQMRTNVQRMIEKEVERCRRSGEFRVSDARAAARAVVGMCNSVPRWYRASGKASPEEIARQYVWFALSIMRYDGPALSAD
jgi:TetR/AcrR family transcriptional regulator, cholesterol catabolism regulator